MKNLNKDDQSKQMEESLQEELTESKETPSVDISKILTGGVILAVFLGGLTGFLAYRAQTGSFRATAPKSAEEVAKSGEEVKKGEFYGEEDGVFRDSAVGVIEKNTDGKEGTHKLIREGGEDQVAYLTSSVLDLNLFLERKVKVWGQTFSSTKVGWLMDVGKIEVLD